MVDWFNEFIELIEFGVLGFELRVASYVVDKIKSDIQSLPFPHSGFRIHLPLPSVFF